MIQYAPNVRPIPVTIQMPKYTGIIEINDEKLILKPNLFPGKLPLRIWGVVIISVVMAGVLVFFNWLFRFQISPYPLIGIWLVQVIGSAFTFFVEDTIIILKSRGNIVRERQFLLWPWRWKKQIGLLAEIQCVLLRENVHAGALAGPPFMLVPRPKEMDWIYLVIDGKRMSFWYTKYREAAVVIAKKLVEFSGAPLEDPEGLSKIESSP